MAVCDANYIRLLKLFPDHLSDTSRIFALPFGAADSRMLVQLRITEKFRYTSTVTLTMSSESIEGLWFTPPCMLVRLYHDACTAEVISYQQTRLHQLENQAGMNHAFATNEKEEANLFLSDWLNLCLHEGMVDHVPVTGPFPEFFRDNLVQEL
jgi:uncharacterized protein YqiB (DUF1249 family)